MSEVKVVATEGARGVVFPPPHCIAKENYSTLGTVPNWDLGDHD